MPDQAIYAQSQAQCQAAVNTFIINNPGGNCLFGPALIPRTQNIDTGRFLPSVQGFWLAVVGF
ncbi:hypothetical protein [Sandaracinobacteroides saxicola]|uniref:Uncharacterized protein n=1 Tax=Sandaracinobacteroides saxicola TaxID=2759707 RepID=A0A7G5IHJ8_9SPHN|nr:hypothetical protein [Sandaracinobacteroides saxicola]QMW22840.1 hypothetical protein H3309_16335 [Sandaracinobacteroides saxicola]